MFPVVPSLVPSLNPVFSCVFPVFPVYARAHEGKSVGGAFLENSGNNWELGTRRVNDDR